MHQSFWPKHEGIVEIVVGRDELRVLGEHLHQQVGGSASVGEEKDPSMSRCAIGCSIGCLISCSIRGSILSYGGHSVEWLGDVFTAVESGKSEKRVGKWEL